MKEEANYKKGQWTEEEDRLLLDYVHIHGRGRWNRVSKMTGLKRCGKSCRLRWMNYLSPSVKHGEFTEQEEDLIIRLHNLLGNRWSLIAGRVPGRTDNQVKNHWNTHLCKRLGIDKRNGTRVRVNSLKTQTSSVEVGGVIRREERLSSAEASLEQLQEASDHCVGSLWGYNILQFSMASPTPMEFLDDPFWQAL